MAYQAIYEFDIFIDDPPLEFVVFACAFAVGLIMREEPGRRAIFG